LEFDQAVCLPGVPGSLVEHVADGGEDPLEDLYDGGDHEQEDNGAQAPRDQALRVHAESRARPNPGRKFSQCPEREENPRN
jgi:hypothetical protein